jgi:uncharacterized Zn finger protein
MSWGWGRGSYSPEYVSVSEKKAKALKKAKGLEKKGIKLEPVASNGAKIAKTFWGLAWCENLERYSDFSNRLPRGRSYLKNGFVIDLKIKKGEINALVAGSDIYKICIKIDPLSKKKWSKLISSCSKHIASLIELLKGGFSNATMGKICDRNEGMFPSPKEIHLDCSCPDWADMCKHVAAVLYGVGARLDQTPEMIFTLRGVDKLDLIGRVAKGGRLLKKGSRKKAVRIADGEISDVFGIEIDSGGSAEKPARSKTASQPSHKLNRPKKTRLSSL